MTTLLEASWDQWEAEVRERGLERGLERGRVEQGVRLLARLAALKFGAGAAKRLAALLEGLPAGEDLERVGDWIIECAAEDETAVPGHGHAGSVSRKLPLNAPFEVALFREAA